MSSTVQSSSCVLSSFPLGTLGKEAPFERVPMASNTETLRDTFRQYYNLSNIIALFAYHCISVLFQLYFSNHLVMLQEEISQEIL